MSAAVAVIEAPAAPSLPVANFLMLNPSTADEVKLDPSCTRARNYAERWGYGALIVTNIFGWRERKICDPSYVTSLLRARGQRPRRCAAPPRRS